MRTYMFWKTAPKRIYLDYAAATPLLPEVVAAMQPYLDNLYANPSSIHSEGQLASAAVEEARKNIARTFEVRPEFITFTSGGTEANNLAIRGSVMAARKEGQDLSELEVITTRIEHPATLKTVEALAQRGVTVQYVSVDERGLIDIEELEKKISANTVLMTTTYANSEIGSIQKLHTIKKTLRKKEQQFGNKILFHVDAAQAPLWLNCQFDAMKADLVTFDAGKCNGPKGVGLLLRSPRVALKPVIYGGGQEDGLRPGTENVAGIVGAAVAFLEAQSNWRKNQEAISKTRDEAIAYIQKEIPNAIVNGAVGELRQANNINISIPGHDTEFATIVLDKHGFAVSTKSACAGAGGGESVVVREISDEPARASSTLRISLAPDTKLSDLKRLTAVLTSHIEKMSNYTP